MREGLGAVEFLGESLQINVGGIDVLVEFGPGEGGDVAGGDRDGLDALGAGEFGGGGGEWALFPGGFSKINEILTIYR